jgi:hypothetical protein
MVKFPRRTRGGGVAVKRPVMVMRGEFSRLAVLVAPLPPPFSFLGREIICRTAMMQCSLHRMDDMRRDMDLIRELMLRLEAVPLEAGDVWTIPYDDERLAVEGHTFAEIMYHVELIHSARFTEPYGNQGAASLTFSGFTWQGHDFIDSVRDPKIWRDTKSTLQKVGGYTLDIVIGVAKGLLKQQLQQIGLPIDP